MIPITSDIDGYREFWAPAIKVLYIVGGTIVVELATICILLWLLWKGQS